MRKQEEIGLRLSSPAGEALRRLSAAAEREILPFVSASRYPQQREKGFVARVSGSRFRIWKVPSATRRRQNICVPLLRGTIEDADGGSRLTGSFALHPFIKLLPLLPLTFLVPAWWAVPKTLVPVALVSLLTACFALIEIGMLRQVGRLRQQEEKDILGFVYELFPESRPPADS